MNTMKRPDYIAGAVYDVDDTLLDNQPTNDPLTNLHQMARLNALTKFADTHDDQYSILRKVTAQESFDSFRQSPVHTVAGSLYVILRNLGIINGEFNPTDPLILDLVALKNEAYALTLAEFGKPIEGADDFVRDFAAQYGIEDKMAIASTAVLRDIKAFLESCNLTYLFPDDRIIDVSRVSRPKPDPEAFDTAFRRLMLPDRLRDNVVALEDDPRGLLAARKAGLYVCGITSRFSRKELEQAEAKPDFIFDTYAELREHFDLPA